MYLLKGNITNTRTRCQICSKLIIKTPERCQWCRSSVFIVNPKHISHLILVFLLLTLKIKMPAGNVFPVLRIHFNVPLYFNTEPLLPRVFQNVALKQKLTKIFYFYTSLWSFKRIQDL